MESIGKEVLLKIYRNMIRTRFLDDKVDEFIASGTGITQHSTRGQEATTNAACAALEPHDYVMPYHRGWGWAIGKGLEPKILLAEVLGKKTGCCTGKGGVHIADWKLRIMGRPGVQCAHLPIAVGVGLSIKLRRTGEVVVCFFGDGASNEGNAHEAMNMASVWKIPIVFICENNMYALFTPTTETTSVSDIAERAKGYAMAGAVVDGNDAIAVYQVAREAISQARYGRGPTLIESKTYRLRGHTVMDRFHLGGYRSKEEVDEWEKKDPIIRLRNKLIEMKTASEEELNEIEAKARQEIKDAARFAKESPYPAVEELFQDVYAD
jgi:TPP-dependent pyruvate/acetoin dehydrogenase alpha subunit